jgi:hypothetical protein
MARRFCALDLSAVALTFRPALSGETNLIGRHKAGFLQIQHADNAKQLCRYRFQFAASASEAAQMRQESDSLVQQRCLLMTGDGTGLFKNLFKQGMPPYPVLLEWKAASFVMWRSN